MQQKIINNLRVTSACMIENAKCGHPGISLSMGPLLYTLYANHLNVIPYDPNNVFRDRFVLSAGHASSFFYALLNVLGFGISVNDLKEYKKLNSITPGHPQYGLTPGVDCSTGPLGEGVATAVGMALAEQMMEARFNKKDLKLFDNYTYALVGDGCLMEGVSYEALSLAGTLKLNRLIVLYDSNRTTIEGGTENTFNSDIEKIMEGCGFNVLNVYDANNIDEINNALNLAKKSENKPIFIILHSIIGWGSHMQGLAKVHGTPLGKLGIEQLKRNLNFSGEPFKLSKEETEYLNKTVKKRFEQVNKNINFRIKEYKRKYYTDYVRLQKYLNEDFADVEKTLKSLELKVDKSMRDIGGIILNTIAEKFENVIGGAADVAPSTGVELKCSKYVEKGDFSQRNLHFGVREFGMACIANGISLYGGLRPFVSTFFVFSDYMKNAMRMAALMNLPVVYILTHDSIAVGEDGPSHHGVEQLWGLRCIPNMDVYRPCDFNEGKACYVNAFKGKRPAVLALCRQKVKNLNSNYNEALKGGYVIKEENKSKKLDGILIASGSEVELAIQTSEILEKLGVNVRVVSMPSTNVFDRQTEAYKDKILPKNIVNRMSIELGSDCGWYKYVGIYGKTYCINEFGKSADFNDLLKYFKFDSGNIAKEFVNLIKKNKKLRNFE